MDSAKPVRFIIYCHTHTESGRRYIGLTKKTMLQRWNQHVLTANKQKRGWSHFANAIRTHGKDAFSHEILEVCYSLEEANVAEIKWIAFFETQNPTRGFNFKRGGDHRPHPVKNPWNRPEFREKALKFLAKANDIPRSVRSDRSKKLWEDPDFRERVSVASKTVMSDPNMRERLSVANKLAKSDPTVKARASRVSKIKWQDLDFRAKNAELWQDPDFRERCQTGLIHGANLNKNKTHCPNGHEYSSENTFINSKESRECLTCSRKSKKESARRLRFAFKSRNF